MSHKKCEGRKQRLKGSRDSVNMLTTDFFINTVKTTVIAEYNVKYLVQNTRTLLIERWKDKHFQVIPNGLFFSFVRLIIEFNTFKC